MNSRSNSKALGISIWIAKFVLAAMFLMAGVMKTTQPIEALHLKMAWTNGVPDLLVRFIGACELLGAIGLLLPSMLRIKPSLTPLAALGLVTIQVLAAAFHMSRSEWNVIGFNVFMGLLALFIWWGRTHKIPIMPKA